MIDLNTSSVQSISNFDLGEKVQFNLSAPKLIEANLSEGIGRLTPTGAIMVDTGIYTGRSPKDKYFVREGASQDHIWWGEVNQPIEEPVFDELLNLVQAEYASNISTPTYIFEGFAGADPRHRLKVRIIAKKAWQALFVHNMFIRATADELIDFEPDFTIINASDVHNPNYVKHGMNSDVFVSFHLGRGLAIIGGTEYGGEMKKGIFSVLNYKLPLSGILSMHCSCNVDPNSGESALFFGLSGTGKTTLSTDPHRPLIGDDEHGWSEDGIFNIEGGCYAKVINLSAEDEPQIYNAIRFGAQLENVVYDTNSRQVDYTDTSKTQNTRVSYPIHFIPNSLAARGEKSMTGHPTHVIFLTCDAFGVLPPVSQLTPEQAMYHFISGYTAKVAGTERGVIEPQATFSPCFGGPFLPLHPLRYAELLRQKIQDHAVKVYLVNTGWSGTTAASGAKRIALRGTRAMIHAILRGDVDTVTMKTDPTFGVRYPEIIDGVEGVTLDPVMAWPSRAEYEAQARTLATRFQENFEKYGEEIAHLIKEGPTVS
jgi:phosphoenolpyruvate carboxykinase (ATP)